MGRVEIIEVSPRDGLQNEAVLVSTVDKARLVRESIAAGFGRIEVTSFAHPRWVPQMADAEALLAELGPSPDGVVFSTLVLNEKGYERAEAAGVDEINVVIPTSQTFCEKNQNSTLDRLLDEWHRIANRARSAGIPASLSFAVAFGCPFEGEVSIDHLVAAVARGVEAEPAEIALADSIGCAVPTDITTRFNAIREVTGDIPLRVHLHNTRNSGLANAVAAVAAGVDRLDSSIGGIGGCPFAPAATGNIPTEDLVWMLERMDVQTGISIAPVLDTAEWIGTVLDKTVPGFMSRAKPFPEVARAGAEPSS